MADVDNNAVLASLGNTADPFESGEVDPHSAQGRLLRVLQAHRINDDYQMILNASHKPKLSEYDQNLQKLAPYVGNPRNIDPLTHTGKGGIADMLVNLPFALSGMRGPTSGSMGVGASPEMGAMFADKVSSNLPKVSQLSNITPPDVAQNVAGTLNVTGGDNANYPPIAPPSEFLKIIKDYKPYDFAAMNQNLKKMLGENPELYTRYRSDMDRLQNPNDPIGPASYQLAGDNRLVQAKNPAPPGVDLVDYVTKTANDRLPFSQSPLQPLFKKMDDTAVSQKDWNDFKRLNSEWLPDGQ